MNQQLIQKRKQSVRQMRRWQRGQSLIELSLTASVLILVFSGAIDLGRAFFTRITMDSAVSEGSHWTAAYPGCFLYGAAFGDMSNVANAPIACQGTNSIFTRMRNESSLLVPSLIQSTYLTPPSGKTANQTLAGDTITIGMTYNLTLITPFMRSIFGNSLTLTVEGKEVLRGTNLPPTTGQATTYTPVSNTPMPTNLTEQRSSVTTDTACNNGYAPVSWQEPAPGGSPVSTPASYQVWIIDPGSASMINATGTTSPNGYLDNRAHVSTGNIFYTFYDNTSAPASVPTSMQIDLTKGGSIMYGIRTKDTSGNYSDFEYILLTCPLVEPSGFSYTCAPQTGTPPSSPSVTFNWTMPNRKAYSWTTAQPTDKHVDGYRIVNSATNAALTSGLSPSITGGQINATTTTYTFTGPTDPARTANFYIVAVDSSSPLQAVGLDNGGNAVSTANGTNFTGHSDNTYDISVSCS